MTHFYLQGLYSIEWEDDYEFGGIFKWSRRILKYEGRFRFGTLWRCGDGLFFEIPPFASDALPTTLHSLLGNVNGVIR
jgi:hypothetical protein